MVFLHTTQYLVQIENYRLQLEPAQQQRRCLDNGARIPAIYGDFMEDFSKQRRPPCPHIGPPTMQLTWRLAILYHMGRFAID